MRVARALLRVAARRWRVGPESDQLREWHGELHALGREIGVPATVRGYRRIAFALSLAASRPPERRAPVSGRRVLAAARPVLLTLAVPLGGVGLESGLRYTLDNSPLLWFVLPFSYGLTTLVSLPVTVFAAVLLGRWASARWPFTGRVVLPPVLLATGVGIAYDRPYDTGHHPALVAAGVVVWVAAVALLNAGSARLPAGRRTRALAVGGVAAVLLPSTVAMAGDLSTVVYGDPVAVALAASTAFALRLALPAAAVPAAAVPAAAASAAGPVAAAVPAAAPGGSAVAVPRAGPAVAALPAGPAVPAAAFGDRTVRIAGLGCGVAGLLILAATLSVPAGVWGDWRGAVWVTAALVTLLGLTLAATGGRWRPPEERRRLAVGVAIVAGYCTSGLFVHGRWNVIAEASAPSRLTAATAALGGLLAALAMVGAAAARRRPPRPRTTAAMAGVVGLATAALGAASGGDGDGDMLVILASLLGQAASVLLVVAAWRITRGRRRGRARRALIWLAALVGALLFGGTRALNGLADFAGSLLSALPDAVGTVTVAVIGAAVLAPLATKAPLPEDPSPTATAPPPEPPGVAPTFDAGG